MLARLGHVLYWTGCLLAALSLTVGWINYPGVDTTGIEVARQRGLSDPTAAHCCGPFVRSTVRNSFSGAEA